MEFFSTKISAIVLAVNRIFWTVKRRFTCSSLHPAK